jgi:hypothetical protein
VLNINKYNKLLMCWMLPQKGWGILMPRISGPDGCHLPIIF